MSPRSNAIRSLIVALCVVVAGCGAESGPDELGAARSETASTRPPVPDESVPSSTAGTAQPTAPSSTASTSPSSTSSTAPSSTPNTSSTVSTSTTPVEVSYFATLPVGASLPSGEWCAARVKPRPETRPMNTEANQTRGTQHPTNPRVDGDFVGTTDEIIQWAACKWGIDEDLARAQAVVESWWDQARGGDETGDQDLCHPEVRTQSGPCPESLGLLQVRYQYYLEAFENSNAIRSTAYNADYSFSVLRSCFEGDEAWLNDVERGADYEAGDLLGCMGRWFSGRWRTAEALDYIARVEGYRLDRTWEDSDFLGYTG